MKKCLLALVCIIVNTTSHANGSLDFANKMTPIRNKSVESIRNECSVCKQQCSASCMKKFCCP